MDRIDTWQEDGVWYAANDDHPKAPVGEGSTEEEATWDLQRKLDKLAEEARDRWEARNDEP